MSRIGNQPITIPDKVNVTLEEGNKVSIKGPKGILVQQVKPSINIKLVESQLIVSRRTDQKFDKALHGLYRVLLNNMVIGVTKGFKKSLQIVGIGYKANVDNNLLELQLGKSHAIYFAMPNNIKATVEITKGKKAATFIHIEGIDKQLVGQIAAKIRDQKPPEAFIGKRNNMQKGVRYVDELLIGKTKKDGK